MATFKNTAQKGSVRYIVFKEKDIWYTVGLEFNIVEYAEDSQIALFRLFEAIKGYVESFKMVKGARPYTLNQKPEKEYEDLWNKLRAGIPVRSPYQIDSFGEKNLNNPIRSIKRRMAQINGLK
ncbi:MAG: hypothetical protein Q8Q92_05075 [bacterium]|nr:hypothetical protein [bacterium]